MPQLGESVTEGTITRWLKAEGEEVEIDEPLAEVDTDKVNAELPSPVAGKIEKFLVPEGTTVNVGTEIVLVADAAAPPATDGPPEKHVVLSEEFPTSDTVAHPVAEELGPVARAPRSGGNGRGEVKDAEGYIERIGAARDTATEEPMPQRIAAGERTAVHEGDGIQDLTSIRRAIANRMAASKREAPHAWTMVEVDMSGLVALREREKDAFEEREGVKLTYLPFIVKAVVESLKENPVLNSVWDGDRIILRKRINIGVAVDLEDALIVPVITDADELNILGLTRKIDDLVRRARARGLGTEDVSGGTFTVNNPGALGS